MNDFIEAVNLDQKVQQSKKKDSKPRRSLPPRRERRFGERDRRRGGGGQRPTRGGRRFREQQKLPRQQPRQPPPSSYRKELFRRTGNRIEQTRRIRRRERREQNQNQNPRQESKQQQQAENDQNEIQPNVIFKGLGEYVSDQKLREICQEYGPLDMCKLDRDPFGNVKPQGIGLVKFENYSDARRASTELNGIRLQDELSKANWLISVKLVEAGEDWRRHLGDGSHLKIQKRGMFKRDDKIYVL